jgi:hypothetical protein
LCVFCFGTEFDITSPIPLLMDMSEVSVQKKNKGVKFSAVEEVRVAKLFIAILVNQ